MTPAMMELARYRCRLHFLQRAAERGIEIDDLRRLESVLDRMRPIFAASPRQRHCVTVLRAGRRLQVVYDTHLACVVSVWLHRWQPR